MSKQDQSIIFSFLLLLLTFITGSVFAQPEVVGSTPNGAAVIMNVDLPNCRIQLGKQQYVLSDDLQVYSADHKLYSRLTLQPGQEINYEFSPKPPASQLNPNSDPEIYKIFITTKVDDSIKS